MHPDDPTSGAAFTTEGEGAEHAGACDFELAPQLALKTSLRLSDRGQGQKNRAVARSGRLTTSSIPFKRIGRAA
jgi:hypothetical protein